MHLPGAFGGAKAPIAGATRSRGSGPRHEIWSLPFRRSRPCKEFGLATWVKSSTHHSWPQQQQGEQPQSQPQSGQTIKDSPPSTVGGVSAPPVGRA